MWKVKSGKKVEGFPEQMAVKVIILDKSVRGGISKEIQNEIDALKRSHGHPNVIEVYHYERKQGLPKLPILTIIIILTILTYSVIILLLTKMIFFATKGFNFSDKIPFHYHFCVDFPSVK